MISLPQQLLTIAVASLLWIPSIHAFSTVSTRSRSSFRSSYPTSSTYGMRNAVAKASVQSLFMSTTSADSSIATTEASVAQLKRVLEREYVSFFSPMEKEYYSPTVTFDDPMTSLAGVDAYQGNVDMLASRTLMGSILFEDAGIALHSVTGGEVSSTDGSISNIITRWTLRVTAKILPWSPTPRFSGVSVYEVKPGGPKGVQVTHQTDYWDSINIQKGGSYDKVDKGTAIQDFLNQLKPNNFAAPPAGLELPFQLLRRGDGYDVRRYPSYSAVKIKYDRRDEAFNALGVFTKNMTPLAPAILQVSTADDKTMMWPLEYAAPGQDKPSEPTDAREKLKTNEVQWKPWNCEVEIVPSRVVAVGRFSDASVEPVVRKADRLLRESCQRDGLDIPVSSEGIVKFAQYDAIYSMGERRGEVWIELEDGGHPW